MARTAEAQGVPESAVVCRAQRARHHPERLLCHAHHEGPRLDFGRSGFESQPSAPRGAHLQPVCPLSGVPTPRRPSSRNRKPAAPPPPWKRSRRCATWFGGSGGSSAGKAGSKGQRDKGQGTEGTKGQGTKDRECRRTGTQAGSGIDSFLLFLGAGPLLPAFFVPLVPCPPLSLCPSCPLSLVPLCLLSLVPLSLVPLSLAPALSPLGMVL